MSSIVSMAALQAVEANAANANEKDANLLRPIGRNEQGIPHKNIPSLFLDYPRGLNFNGQKYFFGEDIDESLFSDKINSDFEQIVFGYTQGTAGLGTLLSKRIPQKVNPDNNLYFCTAEKSEGTVFSLDDSKLGVISVLSNLHLGLDPNPKKRENETKEDFKNRKKLEREIHNRLRSKKTGMVEIVIPGEIFVKATTHPEGGLEILSVHASNKLMKSILEYTPTRTKGEDEDVLAFSPLYVYELEIIDNAGNVNYKNFEKAIVIAQTEEAVAKKNLIDERNKFRIFAKNKHLNKILSLTEAHTISMDNAGDKANVNLIATLDTAMATAIFRDLPLLLEGNKDISDFPELLEAMTWCGVPELTSAILQAKTMPVLDSEEDAQNSSSEMAILELPENDLSKEEIIRSGVENKRSVALLDVDHTLYFFNSDGVNIINEQLLSNLLERGILDLYLFTDMNFTVPTITDRITLIAELKQRGFRVHGVITPSDLMLSSVSEKDAEGLSRYNKSDDAQAVVMEERAMQAYKIEEEIPSDKNKLGSTFRYCEEQFGAAIEEAIDDAIKNKRNATPIERDGHVHEYHVKKKSSLYADVAKFKARTDVVVNAWTEFAARSLLGDSVDSVLGGTEGATAAESKICMYRHFQKHKPNWVGDTTLADDKQVVVNMIREVEPTVRVLHVTACNMEESAYTQAFGKYTRLREYLALEYYEILVNAYEAHKVRMLPENEEGAQNSSPEMELLETHENDPSEESIVRSGREFIAAARQAIDTDTVDKEDIVTVLEHQCYKLYGIMESIGAEPSPLPETLKLCPSDEKCNEAINSIAKSGKTSLATKALTAVSVLLVVAATLAIAAFFVIAPFTLPLVPLIFGIESAVAPGLWTSIGAAFSFKHDDRHKNSQKSLVNAMNVAIAEEKSLTNKVGLGAASISNQPSVLGRSSAFFQGPSETNSSQQNPVRTCGEEAKSDDSLEVIPTVPVFSK